MTYEQWEKLLAVINGEVLEPMPVGFIIDSPWLPGWAGPVRNSTTGNMIQEGKISNGAGISILDYFSSEQMWFEANLKACLLYTSPSPRDQRGSRMPSSA